MIEPRAGALALLVGLCLAIPGRLDGQELTPRRGVGASVVRCPVLPQPATPTPAQRDEGQRLSAQGREAAIAGDQEAAEEFFREAAALDPTDRDIAYRLARVRADLGRNEAAVREFCRYLALAPAAPDAGEVRERIASLSPLQDGGLPADAVTHFRAGLEHLDAGRLQEAEQAFTSAITEAPAWAEAHYNRGLTHSALGRPARAVEDLERYLALSPEAEDRAWVSRHVEELRGRIPTPGGALVRGMLIPGLGQFYTKRPALGLLVLGGVGAATYAAVQPRVETRTEQFIGPFGDPYTSEYEVTTYPSLTLGIAVAAGITAIGALEAYLHARRGRVSEAVPVPTTPADPPRASSDRPPDNRLHAPALFASPRGMGLGLIFEF